MSRPDAINLTSSNIPAPTSAELEAYAQRMVQVLDRGHIIDRFAIQDAPQDMHYEWHKDDPLTHARLSAKGFSTDDELAKKSGFVHTDGSGNPRIADVRLYSIHKSKHAILQKIEEENVKRSQDPRRADKDFMEAIRTEGGFSEVNAGSSAQKIDGLTLTTSLKEK